MLPFSEKLSFLMHITETSNKELAAALGVDSSMISLLRTGKRKLSKNPAQAKKMATFFARRCTAAYQRQALSDMLGKISISPSMPTEILAAHLEDWLQGEKDFVATVLSDVHRLPPQEKQPQNPGQFPATASACEGQTLHFYGIEGRREVMARVMQEIRKVDAPGSILTVVDDNLEWLLSDYQLCQKIQADLMEMMERGFTFYQVMPPMNYINRYTESLQFWLPIYATGQTNAYYYPRLRGNLYRHSIIVVPGRCVQYSCSVGLLSTNDVTMFSTDPQLVRSFEKQFEEILSLCRPALKMRSGVEDAVNCFLEFFSRSGETVQAINSLSFVSMPPELMEDCIRRSSYPQWKDVYQLTLDNLKRVDEYIGQEPYIDICRLATAKEVREGRAPMPSPIRIDPNQPCYTPETYCMHLKNILRLMEAHDNYFFLPVHEKEINDYDLYVKDNGMALILTAQPPAQVMEVTRVSMITAFREHLLRRAEAVGYDGFHRERIRKELRALIQELENSD